MFCMKCGNKMPDDAKFCIACGNRLDAGSVQPVETAQSPYAPPQQQNVQQTYTQPTGIQSPYAQQAGNTQQAYAQPAGVQSPYAQQAGNTQQTYAQPTGVQPSYAQPKGAQSQYAGPGYVSPVNEQAISQKKPFYKKPAVITAMALVIVAAVVAAVFLLKKDTPETKVQNAASETMELLMKPDSVLNQEIGMNSILDKIENNTMQHNLKITDEYDGVDLDFKTDIKNKKMEILIKPIDSYLSDVSIDAYVDKDNLMIGCKQFLDDYLYVNYDGFIENFDSSSLYSLLSLAMSTGEYDVNLSDISGMVRSIRDMSKSFTEDQKNNKKDFLDKITYEANNDGFYELNGSEADSYRVTIPSDAVKQYIFSFADFFRNNADLKKMMTMMDESNDVYNEFIEGLDEDFYSEIEEVFTYFPENLVIYVYILDGIIVKAETAIMVENESLTATMELLGEEALTDEIKLSLIATNEGRENGVVFTIEDMTEDTENVEKISVSMEMQGYFGTELVFGADLEYDRNDDSFTVNLFDEDYLVTQLQGQFSNIVKGESFDLRLTADDSGDEMVEYSVKPCDEVKPFVDYEDALNILDIDMNFITKIANKLEPLF